jgi:hypothetical protein
MRLTQRCYGISSATSASWSTLPNLTRPAANEKVEGHTWRAFGLAAPRRMPEARTELADSDAKHVQVTSCIALDLITKAPLTSAIAMEVTRSLKSLSSGRGHDLHRDGKSFAAGSRCRPSLSSRAAPAPAACVVINALLASGADQMRRGHRRSDRTVLSRSCPASKPASSRRAYPG